MRAKRNGGLERQNDNCKLPFERENLAQAEKIAKAFALCEVYLEKVVATLESGRGELDSLVWRASAELEYVLFLLSLRDENENVISDMKVESHNRKKSAAKLLNKAQELVVQSRESVASDNLRLARMQAFSARSILLQIQRDLSRKTSKSLGNNLYSSST